MTIALFIGANTVSRGATFIVIRLEEATGVNDFTGAANDGTFHGAVSCANSASG